MDQNYIIWIGMALIAIGFLFVFGGSLLGSVGSEGSGSRYSVVGVIGFIPFGFSNDRRLLVISLSLAALIMAAGLAVFLLNIRR